MARRTRRQFHRRGIFLGGYWQENTEKGSSILLQNKSRCCVNSGCICNSKLYFIYRINIPCNFSLVTIPNNIPEENGKPKKGILKNAKEPSLDQRSAFNEFWKTYCFSFSHIEAPYSSMSSLMRSYPRNLSPKFLQIQAIPSHHQEFAKKLCIQNLQMGLYKPQTLNFLDSFPTELTSLEYLQNILFRHLTFVELNPQEQEILSQLQYLKILFNTPIHKLVRERPKEFLISLPKRNCRQITSQTPYYARSLTIYQTVAIYPESSQKRHKFGSNMMNVLADYNSSDSNTGSEVKRHVMPKGVGFITYPDSVEETSFEGTIGGRNLISWEKDTKFPQMGIDQSVQFKLKKEHGRQQMIQSRLRSARVYRRIQCDNWNSYAGRTMGGAGTTRLLPVIPVKRKGFIRRNKSFQSAMQAWFKLGQIKQSLQLVKAALHMGSDNNLLKTEPAATSVVSQSTSTNEFDLLVEEGPRKETVAQKRDAEIRQAIKERLAVRKRDGRRVERKRRFKICLITIAKYLSCGLVPYIMKGECRVFRRKRIRGVDSTERCSTPPLPVFETGNKSTSTYKLV